VRVHDVLEVDATVEVLVRLFLGMDRVSSVTQAAGASGGGVSAPPKALVVLVKTNVPAPAATASSSSVSVPVTLVSTKSCRECVATWDLCSVAV
jgi:hypothetical protein